jgi:hypothetical protein
MDETNQFPPSGNSPADPTAGSARVAYFHEDDFAQVEVVLLSCKGFVENELRRIESGSRPPVPWWRGWTDLILRRPSPERLEDRGISLQAVQQAMAGRLPPFDLVQSGYGSHREDCPAIHAWGHSEYCALFAAARADGIVTALWLSLQGPAPEQAPLWVQALQALPGAGDLLLVDWLAGRIIPLMSGQELLQSLQCREVAG